MFFNTSTYFANETWESKDSEREPLLITINYTGNNEQRLMVRYRYRLKQRDVAKGYRLPNGGLLSEWTHRIKLQWEGQLTPHFSLKAQTEGCYVTAEKPSVGYIGNVQASYEPTYGQHSLRISSGGAFFHTDYATRIYGYERGLLYAYNSLMYYGKGIRGYLFLQYSHVKRPRLSATAKIGSTCYFDRTAIGSGATMIDNNHKEDIQLQVRYIF